MHGTHGLNLLSIASAVQMCTGRVSVSTQPIHLFYLRARLLWIQPQKLFSNCICTEHTYRLLVILPTMLYPTVISIIPIVLGILSDPERIPNKQEDLFGSSANSVSFCRRDLSMHTLWDLPIWRQSSANTEERLWMCGCSQPFAPEREGSSRHRKGREPVAGEGESRM